MDRTAFATTGRRCHVNGRNIAIESFIAQSGWAQARVGPLAGDASNRRYLRLQRRNGARAVLMDAPPEKGEDVRPFLRIAVHLRGADLCPPQIIAADPRRGLLLLEDLGDTLFARVLQAEPEREETLYAAATDVLIHLHDRPLPPDVPTYDAELMGELASLPLIWYAPDAGVPAEVHSAMTRALKTHAPQTTTLALRDYHAENLIWLGGKGMRAVGLLDFQDAMVAHPLYDLVSLLTDARRDVRPSTRDAMCARYKAATGWSDTAFKAAFATLSAQRNLRILGVFARLCLRDGKPTYLSLMPRVWDHLQTALAHPGLAELRDSVAALPAPTAAVQAELERACGSRPSR